MEEYRRYLESLGRSPNTIQTYLLAVQGYQKWYRDSFGQEPEQLYRPNILDYKSYLVNIRKLKEESVNARLAALMSYNRFLIASGRQEQLVIDKETDYIPVQTIYASPSVVSQTEVDAFRQAILASGKDFCQRDYAMVTLLAYAGLRDSEMVNLLLADVDLTSRELVVRQGKGGKRRIVYLGDKVLHAIKEYLPLRSRQHHADSPYLFVSRQAPKLHRSRVNQICSQYSQVITPHTLRHFFCSHALETGAYTIAELANQAGHANVRTTLRYTNPSIQKMKEKANSL